MPGSGTTRSSGLSALEWVGEEEGPAAASSLTRKARLRSNTRQAMSPLWACGLPVFCFANLPLWSGRSLRFTPGKMRGSHPGTEEPFLLLSFVLSQRLAEPADADGKNDEAAGAEAGHLRDKIHQIGGPQYDATEDFYEVCDRDG